MQILGSVLLLGSMLNTVAGQALIAPVQTYFVPLPEEQLFRSFEELNSITDGDIISVVSIAIAADNTLVYFDHHEDGYDNNFLFNVANKQPSTQIWGDGDLTNGVAPGTQNDILSGGSVIVLDNTVPVNPRGSKILYDGSDCIQATLPIAVTRYAYPTVPGSLLAGAVEIFNQQSWGRRFIVPVGQNTIDKSNDGKGTGGFEYSRFFVMAGADNTLVYRNGVQIGTPFNKGDSVDFNIDEGDIITSSRPIQVDLIAGDIGDVYEVRWFAQVDADDWTNEYVSPVCETFGNTGFWFRNPNDRAITITWSGGNTDSGSFTIPASSSKYIAARETDYQIVGETSTTTVGVDATDVINVGAKDTMIGLWGFPSYFSGIKFQSKDNFYALCAIDADGSFFFGPDNSGHAFDWGFPMIPSSRLTSQALVALGRGCTNKCTMPTDQGIVGSRSVVWVTPMADTIIFVDFDGDGKFDFNTRVNELMSLRITDDPGGPGQGDFDMTGAIIASSSQKDSSGQPVGSPIKIAVVWGQDPIRSVNAQSESLDLGSAVLPLANPDVLKDVVTVYNPDGTIDNRKAVDQVGDIISYIIIVSNVGFADLSNVQVNDPMLKGRIVGPVESKITDGILERGETFTYYGNYTVTASDMSTMGGGDNNLENTATITTAEFPPVIVSVDTPIFLATISGNVQEDTNNDDAGEVNIAGVKITLKKIDGTLVGTTLTDAEGNYKFVALQAGDYEVTETNLAGYTDVKDKDGGPDLNKIGVPKLVGGMNSINNDFVDERPGMISGSVMDNFNVPLVAVTINLKDSAGTIVATTVTSSTGTYQFTSITPGSYSVQEINLPNYVDVSDQDNSDDGDPLDQNTDVDGKIAVFLNSNEHDTKNDFVDRLRNGAISGKVSSDDGSPLPGTVVKLLNSNSTVIATMMTKADGTYMFTEVVPGIYTVQETNRADHPRDVSDQDQSNDGDTFDTNTVVDNKIGVKVAPGELDADNDFVDSNNGSITGTVKEDKLAPIPGVLISLNKVSDNSTIATTLSDFAGAYSFLEVEPGLYNLYEKNVPEYPLDVSDKDTTNDGDSTDSNIAVDNIIGVDLKPGETDTGNDFVDSNNGIIKGTVKSDNLIPLGNVKIELLATDGATVIETTKTNAQGNYEFQDVEPGEYTVRETNPVEYPANIMDQDTTRDGDPTDMDTVVDNLIGVKLSPGETDGGNDFIDGDNGSISGSVKNIDATPIPLVLIALIKDGDVIATTLTGQDGTYIFSDVEPGAYKLKETNLPGYDTDVSDKDDTPDDAGVDENTIVDNTIDVVLKPNEDDKDNNFVDSDRGSISGNVSEDGGSVLIGVTVTLKTQAGVLVAESKTDSNGNYIFSDVKPGLYNVIETNPAAYPSNVKDQDITPDGDAGERILLLTIPSRSPFAEARTTRAMTLSTVMTDQSLVR